MVSLENGYLPKLKPRRVSAIRDFPPGCGRNVVPTDLKPEENGVDVKDSPEVADLMVENYEADKLDSDGLKAPEMPTPLKLSEMKISEVQNPAGSSGVDMPDLDALVERATANANFFEDLVIEIGPLGFQFPNEVVNNPVELERDDTLDTLVGNVETTVMMDVLAKDFDEFIAETEGIRVDNTPRDMEIDSSKAGCQKLLKQLVQSSGVEEEKPISNADRPKDKCRPRRVFAVRDFPPHCGTNVPLPVEEGPADSGSGMETEFQREIVHGLMAAPNCPWRKAEASMNNSDGKKRGLKVGHQKQSTIKKPKFAAALDSEPKADGSSGPSQKKTAVSDSGDGSTDSSTYFNDYESPLKITPISMLQPSPDNSDDDSVGPVKTDVVVYSPGGSGDMMPSHNVHGVKSAPNHPLKKVKTGLSNSDVGSSQGEKRKQDLTWRKKGKAVARKSTPTVKFSGLPFKKKQKTFHTSDDVDKPKKSRAGLKPRDFEINLPPFGVQNSGQGDARNRVRETLRLFHAICRKCLQQQEANSDHDEEGKSKQFTRKPNRIDLHAAKTIKEQGREVNTGHPILGEVPGVEVGDEFQYRVELAVVGIHRLYQAGIDSMKLDNGMPVAVSIISSGAYADDVEHADTLIYSGQGGNVVVQPKQKCKDPADQKLEKGNLALKNSITTQTPVRVVRGWKETKVVDPADQRPKTVTTYIYDGLYTVTSYWTETGPHGKQVFMFELKRNPGQPELAWKELKKSSKSKIRAGVCVADISGGKEAVAISAVNTLNKDKPPSFEYISKMKYPNWHRSIPPAGCDCIGRCSDSRKCRCAAKNEGEIPYNRNGALVETKPLVYECGPHCKCPPSCYNRVSQRGIKFQLEIFKTESRGWGVRSLTSIPSGSFICEYTGELLEDKEAEKRIGSDEYLFDIGQNYNDYPSLEPEEEAVSVEHRELSGYTIDALHYGNVGRFINHSCLPNLHAQNVIYDHDDKKMPHVMLFAMENIPPLQELTYHYNYSIGTIRDSDGNVKVKKCYCGTAKCTGRLY